MTDSNCGQAQDTASFRPRSAASSGQASSFDRCHPSQPAASGQHSMLQHDLSLAVDPIHENPIFCRSTMAASSDPYPAYLGDYWRDTRGSKGDNTVVRQMPRSATDPRAPCPVANLVNTSDPSHGDASVGATVVSPSTPSVSDLWSYPISLEGAHTQVAIPAYTMGRPFECILPYSGAHTMGTLNEDGQRHRMPLDYTTIPAFDMRSQDWTVDSSTAEFWASIEEFELHPAFSTIIPSVAESSIPAARVDHGHTASIVTYDCAAPLLPCYRAPTLFTDHESVEHRPLVCLPTCNPTTAFTNAISDRLVMSGSGKKSTVDMSPFLLMALPTEVRLMIYGWHLVSRKRIVLVQQKDLSYYSHHRAICKVNRHSHRWSRKLECTDPFSGVTKVVRAPRSKLELLRVSQSIHNEALGEFCAKNIFQFRSLAEMNAFAVACPRRVRLFKQVMLTFESPPPRTSSWSTRLQNFQALENLQLLIDHQDSTVVLNQAKNLETARGMASFMHALRGIKKLEIVGKDQIMINGTLDTVDVNHPDAFGPKLRRMFMRPRLAQ